MTRRATSRLWTSSLRMTCIFVEQYAIHYLKSQKKLLHEWLHVPSLGAITLTSIIETAHSKREVGIGA
jgi:hypothetical protein